MGMLVVVVDGPAPLARLHLPAMPATGKHTQMNTAGRMRLHTSDSSTAGAGLGCPSCAAVWLSFHGTAAPSATCPRPRSPAAPRAHVRVSTETLESQMRSQLPSCATNALVWCITRTVSHSFSTEHPAADAKEVGVGNPAEETTATGLKKTPILFAGCQLDSG